ncbi:MAG TPA: extracellular solute-binding protein [Ktedonobacteraceae bacterium]|nr:extracellular solute-binding protein [Ktedonobacteraceae bacterium]
MKRNRVLLSLLAIMAILMVACGSGGNGSSGSGKVTINWWHINTADPLLSGWKNLAYEYMQSHPNVQINITVIGNDPFKTKLNTAMQAGTPPDIFQSWGGGVLQQYAAAGLLKDITPDLQTGGWIDTFSPAALSLYSYQNKYYGVPWDIGAVGFWYNKDLFAKAGITQLPVTWADFVNVIKRLKAAGIAPIALGEKDEWPGAFYWEYFAVRLGGKTAFDNAYNHSGGSFTDPPFVEAGNYLQQLVALHPFQNGFLGASYNDHQAIMGNGQAAMELMGQWAPANDASAATDKKGPNFGFFPFPTLPNEAGDPTDVLGGGNGFAIGKNAPPEAVDFVRFLTSATNQRALAQKGALLPPVKAALDGVTNSNLQAVVQLVSNAPYYQLYYDQFMSPAVGTTVNDQTARLFASTSTPTVVAQAINTSAAAGGG